MTRITDGDTAPAESDTTPAPASSSPTGPLPVCLAGDEGVLDELLRLAAAAGCELERVADLGALRARWSRAPLVLLDATAASTVARGGLPRRSGVVVACQEEPAPTVWEHAVDCGAEQVLVLPDAEQRLVRTLADALDGPTRDEGRTVAVVGGRGGAGASVFAAAVALAASHRGRDALLVDIDQLGGGLDLVLGAEADDGLRWPGLRVSGGRVAVSSLHAALPGRPNGTGRLTMLSCDREGPGPDTAAVAAVLESGRRAGELVACDLPRDFTEPACVALERADLTVVVIPAEVRACAAARRVAARITECGADARALVRGPAPGGLRAGEIADAAGLPLLAAMRPEPTIEESLERGDFRVRAHRPIAAAADTVLAALWTTPEARVAS